MTVRTTYPIAGWVWDWMYKPCSGTAQMPTLAKWGAYLQQRSTLSTSPLWAGLQKVLGPVIYVDEKSTVPVPIEEMEASPFQEGQEPIPSDAWYIDASCRGHPAVWTAVAVQTETEMIWFDTGVRQSSQWAEHPAIWLVAANETPLLPICIDSWAVYWGHYGSLCGIQINGWSCIDHCGDRLCGKTFGN